MSSRLQSRYDFDDAQARLYVRLRERVETAFGHGVEGLTFELQSRVQDRFLTGFQQGIAAKVPSEEERSLSDTVDSNIKKLRAAIKALDDLRLG